MNSFVRILQNLGPSRIMAVGAVMLGIIGFFVYLMGAASSPSMSLMFSQLEPAEAAKILDKLDAMGVPNEAEEMEPRFMFRLSALQDFVWIWRKKGCLVVELVTKFLIKQIIRLY